jgi:hypothetical protein
MDASSITRYHYNMNLYIFNETSPAAVFGVGTYIRELTTALKGSEINIWVVNLKSNKPHILFEEIDGIRHWYLPAPINEQRKVDLQIQRELYYQNVVYLLQLHIKDRKMLIFHLNYMECKSLADALKSIFDCKIVLVVHYIRTCMLLLGNISRLRKIISQTVEPTDAIEILAKEYFHEEKKLFQSHSIDKIICLSNHAFDLLHQDYQVEKEKMVVIYNGLTDCFPIIDKQPIISIPNTKENIKPKFPK